MSDTLASACPPILLIIFKRPDTTRQVMSAIRAAKPERLYIAADGPRPDREGEAEACEAARRLALDVDWPCQVSTLFRMSNLGCRKGVSTAIDWFFEQEEEGVILEDDIVPVPSFFQYCAELLQHYRNDTRIAMIGGLSLAPSSKLESSYYFSRITHVWGWASWRRAWKHYDRDMRLWPAFKSERGFHRLGLSKRFSSHYCGNFDAVAAGILDTWDYQWAFSALAANMLSICPNINLVRNVGFGAGATHTTESPDYISDLQIGQMQFPIIHPSLFLVDDDADLRVVRKETISRFERLRSRLKRSRAARLLR